MAHWNLRVKLQIWKNLRGLAFVQSSGCGIPDRCLDEDVSARVLSEQNKTEINKMYKNI